jgi:ABC-type branched-subunit amino acid transport system substrate-binding protein
LALAAVLGVSLFYLKIVRASYLGTSETKRLTEDWAENGLSVGIVWPKNHESSFVEGVQVALAEINARGGPLAGKVRLRMFEEREGSNGAEAADVAARGDIVAVIGHHDSAIPASLIYEKQGILFLTPKSTTPRLTTHGFQYVFRLTPDDRAIAQAQARFAVKLGAKRIGVLYARTSHGESYVPRFLEKARDEKLQIAFCRSYLPHERHARDLRPLIAEVIKEDFDAIVIADQVPRAARLVRDLDRMGVKKPILGSDKMDSAELWQVAGENVYVASAVDPSSSIPAYLTFKESFKSQHGLDPGYGASQGYEALWLLADAAMVSRTADPLIMATTLRLNSWKGMFGEFSFTRQGDVIGRRISVKRMQNGNLMTVYSEDGKKP